MRSAALGYLSEIIAADNNADKASKIASKRVFLSHSVNYELASSCNGFTEAPVSRII